MELNKNYIIIDPSEASMHFNEDLLHAIKDEVSQQFSEIDADPQTDGNILFVIEENEWTINGVMKIAVAACKEYVDNKKPVIHYLKYYLFKEDPMNPINLPDEILSDYDKLESHWPEQPDILPPFISIENEIWLLIVSLRGDLAEEGYYVILYLLVLEKEGFLKEVKPNDQHIAEFINSSSHWLKDNNNLYQAGFDKIQKYFEKWILRLDDNIITSFIRIVRRSEDSFEEEFSDIFDSILYKLSKSQGRFGAEYIQPLELSRFICGISNLTNGGRVYNPFAGLASFEVFMDGDHYYLGQEQNERTWAIGALRLMAHNKMSNSKFILGDSMNNWNPELQKYDLIVANPPFLQKLPKAIAGQFGNINSFTQFVIENGVHDLTENGKLIVVVPIGFLVSAGIDAKLRKFLVENDLLEMIISFPGGLLMNTSIPIAVVVINKNKTQKGVVRFIDASKFVDVTEYKEKRLNDYALNGSVVRSTESDYVKLVTNEKIVNLEFNLSVKRYFQKEVKGISLNSLVTHVKGERLSKEEIKGKFVRIRDLKDDRLNHKLDYDVIESTEIPQSAIRISESVLLLATRWKNLKPTNFVFKGHPIYITPDVIAISIDESKVYVDYLINELHSEYIEDQLNVLRVGETIPMIRTKDLLSIKVELPSIEEQRAKVLGAKEAYIRIRKSQVEEEAIKYGIDRRLFSEFASLKHSLGSPLQNILSNNNVLLNFLENDKSESLKIVKDYFKKQLDEDLVELIRSVKNDVKQISELLDKGENGIVLENYPLTEVTVEEIEQLISQVKNSRYTFNIELNFIHSLVKEDWSVRINKLLFKIMIENILENANKYAFDEKGVNNKVIIDLDNDYEDNLILTIKNNGKPFQIGYTEEMFITKYFTSDRGRGNGIGGYDINRIAEYFTPEWKLFINEDKVFPVKFIFWFPLLL